MTSSTSRSRPTSGSSRPAAASSVRFRPSCESQGNSFGSRACGERRARAAAGTAVERAAGVEAGGGAGVAAGMGVAIGVEVGLDPRRGLEVLERLLQLGVDAAQRGRVGLGGRGRRRRRGGAARGRRGGGRGDVHRLELLEPPRHAGREVGEGDVAERGELQPAGGEELVGEARAHPAHGDEEVQAVDLLARPPTRRPRAPARAGRARCRRAPSACPVIVPRMRSSSTPRSLSRISARFGTVKKARSWCALVSFWFTLAAMSAASARTCASSIDSITWGIPSDDAISTGTGQFFGGFGGEGGDPGAEVAAQSVGAWLRGARDGVSRLRRFALL